MLVHSKLRYLFIYLFKRMCRLFSRILHSFVCLGYLDILGYLGSFKWVLLQCKLTHKDFLIVSAKLLVYK